MGEKVNNLAGVWNEGFLNWDTVFGAGFDSAPSDWVSVWRECSPDELVKAASQGMSVPLPEMRPPDIRKEMELLDSFRPDSVKSQGISRLYSIYASPAFEDVPEIPHRQERVVVEMLVNPGEAYVGDMDFITALIPFIGASRVGLERFHGAFRKYWESVISLTDFLDRYERLEMADGGHWVIREANSDLSVPKTFFAPEILIQTPTISERHIRLA